MHNFRTLQQPLLGEKQIARRERINSVVLGLMRIASASFWKLSSHHVLFTFVSYSQSFVKSVLYYYTQLNCTTINYAAAAWNQFCKGNLSDRHNLLL